ncbi:GH23376 [Drosophila grimshawi]|uniref:GH23376 n=1 Tax=Drosophila grimshawi TaxID=7222 RepID=B4K4B0_DROGR|nr:GH23376 [Drosophila grimshawi]
MDSSVKPERKNPRERANCLSQLIFAWAVPLLFRGSRQGLTTDDLTACLKDDHSEQLGDRLEEEWYKELEHAHRKSHKPRLRNALFRCFKGPTIINGIICFVYIVIKTLIPVILAQLLLQFQQGQSPVAGVDQIDAQHFASALNRTARGVKLTSSPNFEVNSPNALDGNDPLKEHIKGTFPEEAANITELNALEEGLRYVWNDVSSLAAVLVGSTLFACFLIHHVDLRQRLMGARMRIACCSLIYRKTLRVHEDSGSDSSWLSD